MSNMFSAKFTFRIDVLNIMIIWRGSCFWFRIVCCRWVQNIF